MGLISYHKTLGKEIVAGGIHTISSDFTKMRKRMVQMILNKEYVHIENAHYLILRSSLGYYLNIPK